MQDYSTEAIRNVALISHSGVGKTTLSEAALFLSKAITRLGKVSDGTTASDFDPEEIKRQISINLSLIPVFWRDSKINLIDTPGYADFMGEVKAALRVADGAIVVVCAASGVEVGTEQVWEYAEAETLPRLIFINKMDRENANFQRTVEEIQDKLARRCVPLQFPIGAYTTFKGMVDLIEMKAYGATEEEIEIPPAMETEIKEYREKLVEMVVELDDDLTLKYLEGEEITSEELYSMLRQGIRGCKLVPILTGSALLPAGMHQLLKAICDYLPSPQDAREVTATNLQTQQQEIVTPDVGSPLAALVFKSSVDPYVGKLNYFRVYSGSIESNSQVWNASKEQSERIGQIYMLRGKTQEAVNKVAAGDIGAVAKLSVTATGDTLSTQAYPLSLQVLESPPSNFSVALYPSTKLDVDKMGTALSRLVEEDTTLKVRRDPDTGETILMGIGDTQVEVAVEKMQRKFGVKIDTQLPKVPYKETIRIPSKADYKHKKQTGGHGQYGHVILGLDPLPRGGGFEFAERIVGGVVPKNYIPAVEKGVLEAQHEGILARYPVVDVKVTLVDGSFHPVDSSEISFKIAATQAVKKGLSQGQPVLLEPIMHLHVTVPESFTGDIISDLNTKRAKVLGMFPQDGGQVIEADVPLAEIQRYAIDVRSITQGRGTYTTEFSCYEEVPSHLAQKIIEGRMAEKE